jgi:hypothetical protein
MQTSFRSQGAFPDGTTVSSSLGLVLAFRAAVFGVESRPTVHRILDGVFHEAGSDVLMAISDLAWAIAFSARRRLRIAPLTCPRATNDELSVCNLISALQKDHKALVDARLLWLVRQPAGAVREKAETVATLLLERGVVLSEPPLPAGSEWIGAVDTAPPLLH